MTILFLHGWTSVPGGVKPSFLARHGHTVLNPKLPDEDFAQAVRIAQAEFDVHQPEIVVGSSRGGAVAMNMNSGDAKLVLLCPAWKRWGRAITVKAGTVILHSRADDVIPFADSEELIRNSPPDSSLIEVGSDHRLAEVEPLEAMLQACEEKIAGCDFGVPASAGNQAKKIILIEAIRTGKKSYSVRPTGRNERLVRKLDGVLNWRYRRRGWTLPELTDSLTLDPSLRVAAFDFPFSIPVSLLNDAGFAGLVGQDAFGSRDQWAKHIGSTLRLQFSTAYAHAKLVDLAKFNSWRDKKFWKKRRTDEATNASPPLKHLYQNVFSMTVAGAAMLERLQQTGVSANLVSADMPVNGRIAFETYPSAVANRIGFRGSYKKQPERCLETAEAYLAAQGITLDFHPSVRQFCIEYRTAGTAKGDKDPDGADAFLCLVAAICFREQLAEQCRGDASDRVLYEEGCIIVPKARS